MDDTATASSTLLERVKRKYPALPSQPPLAIPQKADNSLLERIKNKYPIRTQEDKPIAVQPITPETKQPQETPIPRSELLGALEGFSSLQKDEPTIREQQKAIKTEIGERVDRVRPLLNYATQFGLDVSPDIQSKLEKFYTTGSADNELISGLENLSQSIGAKEVDELKKQYIAEGGRFEPDE